jgi:hypothetical protein
MKIQYQGKEVEANEVEVILSKEQWNEYQLSDGKILLLKTVLVDIQKIEGETNPDGTPIYQYQTHLVPRVR